MTRHNEEVEGSGQDQQRRGTTSGDAANGLDGPYFFLSYIFFFLFITIFAFSLSFVFTISSREAVTASEAKQRL